MSEGLFIAIYGINNIGKTTQVKLLVEELADAGVKVEYLKYPIYDLEPTGPQLNEILRSGKEQSITEDELQTIYVQNRRDYQPQLCQKINDGTTIIAEDYVGTGLAWGWAKGADLEKLIALNRGLLQPDLEILLDGERFLEARETIHLHEQNTALADQCRQNYLELAARFNWPVVNANQTIAEVASELKEVIENRLSRLFSQNVQEK